MFYEKIGVDRVAIKNKAEGILAQMTLLEKALLLSGNFDIFKHIWLSSVKKEGSVYNPRPIPTFGCKRLDVPPIGFSDGPRGVTMGFATCFPVSMARGASFDRDIERAVGDIIGKEVRAFEGGNYFAGICINLLRHPAWGRAQETYGEDPYHVGEFGLALTEQVQSHNVMGCVKHYAVNNIENSRFRVDIHADERTLHEVYLPHFKKCVVQGGAASLMGAYNRFEGEQVCESKKLLTDIAREQWSFEGFHISDFFFGIRDAVKALNAGMDVEMPAPIHYHKNIVEHVEQGRLGIAVVDACARRVIETTLAFTGKPDKQTYSKQLVACAEHTQLARRVAEESMTLIKNEGEVLPLSKAVKKLLLVGDFAVAANLGDNGSSMINPVYTVSPMQGLANYFGDSVELLHCGDAELAKARSLATEVDAVLIFAGCDASDEGEFLVPDDNIDYSIMARGYKNTGRPLRAWLFAKLANSGQKDMEASTEEGKGVGGDRVKLGVRDSQAAMIKAIGRINPNTVVNLVGGSMIMTADWDDQAPTILYNWYAGMEGGNALARVLFGEVNPSGKLPFSTPHSESDLPYFSNEDNTFTYDYYHGYTLLDRSEHPIDGKSIDGMLESEISDFFSRQPSASSQGIDESGNTLQSLLAQPQIPGILRRWRPCFSPSGSLTQVQATRFIQQVLGAFENVDFLLDYRCTGGYKEATEGEWNDYAIYRPGRKRGWGIHLTTSGAATYNCLRRRLEVGPGGLILMAPDAFYDYGRSCASSSWGVHWVVFHADSRIVDLLNWPEVGAGVYHLQCTDPEELDTFTRVFREVASLSDQSGIDAIRLRHNLLEEILLRCQWLAPAESSGGVDRRIQLAIAYLEDHYSEQISLAEVAAAANVSVSSLARLFKQHTGLTVLGWRDERRMAQACGKLTHSSLRIAEIAASVGYSDQMYFSRAFHRHFGQSPSAYRKHFLAN